MKRRPFTGIWMVLTGLLLVHPQRGGVIGHWLATGLGFLVGPYGTTLVAFGLFLGALAVSGVARTMWLIAELLSKSIAKRLWLRQVRRAPRVAPRPLATKPIVRDVTYEPPHPWMVARKLPTHDDMKTKIVESEVRGGLSSLGYSKTEIDRTIKNLDLHHLTTEKALREGISLLRNTN